MQPAISNRSMNAMARVGGTLRDTSGFVSMTGTKLRKYQNLLNEENNMINEMKLNDPVSPVE
jgi:hypothetical protein